MSTAALKTSNVQVAPITVIRTHPDLLVLVIAAPIFAFAGWPMLGFVLGSTVWLVQTVVHHRLQSRVERSENPRAMLGVMAGGAVARAWFTGVVILAVGLYDERVGLSALLLVLAAFTVYFNNSVFRSLKRSASGSI